MLDLFISNVTAVTSIIVITFCVLLFRELLIRARVLKEFYINPEAPSMSSIYRGVFLKLSKFLVLLCLAASSIQGIAFFAIYLRNEFLYLMLG